MGLGKANSYMESQQGRGIKLVFFSHCSVESDSSFALECLRNIFAIAYYVLGIFCLIFFGSASVDF